MAMTVKKLALICSFVLFTGCATQIQQSKMNDGRESFKKGELNNTIATIQQAFPNKNTPYY